MFLSGKGTYQIATQLTKEGVLTPGLQMEMATSLNNLTSTTNKWRHETIKRILTNRIYIGECVQNKTKKISYKSKKIVRLPVEEYTIFKKHHQPIIDIDDWNKVQNLLENRKHTKIKDTDVLLKGLVTCSNCDCKYVFISRTRKNKTRNEQVREKNS